MAERSRRIVSVSLGGMFIAQFGYDLPADRQIETVRLRWVHMRPHQRKHHGAPTQELLP
jgi:hypothetical protein